MEKTPSTISDNNSVTLLATVREQLKDCPVAMRLYDQHKAELSTSSSTGLVLPLGAVAVVTAVDSTIATADQSVRSHQVTVRRFAREFDERSLAALVLAHLTIAQDMLNPARPMKPEAMAQTAKDTARMLLGDDMDWNLADLRIVAERIAHGEIYGGLNAPTVHKAFLTYMEEKGEAFARLRQEENEQHKGDTRRENRTLAERRKNREAMHEYMLGRMQKTEVSSQKTGDRSQETEC